MRFALDGAKFFGRKLQGKVARKIVKWTEGDIFLVLQSDGKASIGQILRHVPGALNSVICSFFDQRVPPGVEVSIDQLSGDSLISIQFVTPDLLKSGVWPLVGHGAPRFLDRMSSLLPLERADFVGAVVEGSGIIRKFLDAYYGLRPWDDFADPAYFDKLLLPTAPKPPHLVLTRNAQG